MGEEASKTTAVDDEASMQSTRTKFHESNLSHEISSNQGQKVNDEDSNEPQQQEQV